MDKKQAKDYRAGSTKPADGKEVIKTFDGFSSEQIASVFSRYEGQIGQLVSKQIRDRFVQIAITVISKERIIKECTQESVMGAFLSAAMYELEILPQFGHCYFVPYRNKYKENMRELQFQIGYQGYAVLMIRGGAKDVFAQQVYEHDIFEVNWADEIPIIHKPLLIGDPGQLAYVWGRIDMGNGIKKYGWMNRAQVEKRRDKSRSSKDEKGGVTGIWKEWPDEMWKKTIIRDMRKTVPMKTREGPDVQNILLADGAVIPASMLTSGKGIDLSKVRYPEQEEEKQKVKYDNIAKQENGPDESETAQAAVGDLMQISVQNLKFLIDAMKKAKVKNLLEYVGRWGIKELSIKSIKIEQAKVMLYDLAVLMDLENLDALIEECFNISTTENGKIPQSNGGDKQTVSENSEPLQTSAPDDIISTPPTVKEGETKAESPQLKAEKSTVKSPYYDVREIRQIVKQKSKALSEKGIYTIGDLIAGFGCESLTNTDCDYETYRKMKEFLEMLPNDKIQPKGEK